MSWTRYLKHDFFTAQELNDVERRFDRIANREHQRGRSAKAVQQRVEELEDELGRMSLFVCVLMELGLGKGAFTMEEFQAAIGEADRRDGDADGKLDPDWMKSDEERDADEARRARPTPRPSKRGGKRGR